MTISKEEAIKKYGKTPPGTKHVFLNFEEIRKEDGLYTIVINELNFSIKSKEDIQKNFTEMHGGQWYPQPHFFRKIAECTNIQGYGSLTIKDVDKEIDINPMLAKPIEDPPTMRLMHVATQAFSSAKILCQDGTWRVSPECVGEHNFWNKAVKAWNMEEKYSNGYTKGSGFKYKNKFDRRGNIDILKEHATSIAKTKSFNAAIIYLIGLSTGFTYKDLTDSGGVMVFQKYIESPVYQKKVMTAKIDAIRNGNTEPIKQITSEILGEPEVTPPIPPDVQDADVIDTTEVATMFKQNINMPGIPDPPDEREMVLEKIADFMDMKGPNRKFVENETGAIEGITKVLASKPSIEKLKETLDKIKNIKGIKTVVKKEEELF